MLLPAFANAQAYQPMMPNAGTENIKPAVLDNVGIDQKLDAQVPADLVFHDETGKDVKLGDYFGKRPLILSLVYFKCPQLCTVVLNDLVRTMNAMNAQSIGKQFDVLTVSFDPTETPELSAAKKKQYLKAYGREGAAEGWHFLTGSAESIKKADRHRRFPLFVGSAIQAIHPRQRTDDSHPQRAGVEVSLRHRLRPARRPSRPGSGRGR